MYAPSAAEATQLCHLGHAIVGVSIRADWGQSEAGELIQSDLPTEVAPPD